MAVPEIDFRFSTTADWSARFSLRRFTPGATLPWDGVPPWAPNTAFGPGDARIQAEDLYFADPAVVTAPWTSAASFAADVDPLGRSRWKLFGSARQYRSRPIDLTGAELTFAIMPCDASGNITDPRVTLRAGTEDGSLVITNAALGGVAFAVPKALVRAQGVRPSLYRYDITALLADRSNPRLRYGLLLVDQGIVP